MAEFSNNLLPVVVVCCFGFGAGPQADEEVSGAVSFKAFELKELSAERARKKEPYLRFVDEPSMSVGLYELPKGTADGQSPHEQDEIYYVVEGQATLEVDGERASVEPGAILYVKAGVEHRFVEIGEDLKVLVVFPKADHAEQDPAWRAHTVENARAKRKPDENVWNKFLDVATMRLGLYMLPAKLGGDATLTHEVDEVNLVVKGRAKFKMGDDEIDIRPGSVVWVRRGVGHSFHALSEDLEVLILFEKR